MSAESEVALQNLREDINAWVDDILPADYPKYFPPIDALKVIREAVLGYQVLKPHEYLILDSPVVQRLRYIHQNALAYLVYPTATHTRFDHSLGVAKIAEEIGCTLKDIDSSQIEELRLAGLLHDVGHSIFSHISETVMKNRFEKIYRDIKEDRLFEDCSMHEIISYLIVRSPRFNQLLEKVFNHYGNKINIERISQLIIGKPSEPTLFAFMGDIIHGPFDADKLDYLVRDCHFTGIRADVDVPRVEISSKCLDPSKFVGYPNKNLIMDSAGVSNLEQVVLNRILLFSAIYHHHKVRALECMFKAIYDTIWENPKDISNPLLRFEKVSDFFRISEYDFFSMGSCERKIAPLINNLLNRELLKRCLIISPNMITESNLFEEHDLYKLGDEYPKQISKLRKLIWDEVPRRFRTSFHELWVDLPEPPNIDDDVDRCWIDVGTEELFRLRDFLPYGEWLDAYEARKWQGHVFYVPDPEYRKVVNGIAQTVFRDLFGLQFSPAATNGCKYN